MTIRSLLSVLADGRFHSGRELGEQLQVSRSAIWKQIRKVEELGVEIYSVKGRGYRLPGGLDLLEISAVRDLLKAEAASQLGEVALELSMESTNLEALSLSQRQDCHGRLFVAEQQTAGRGRRGRQWVSPFGRNLYFSLVWRFEHGAAALEGLSLVVGLALKKALAASGIEGVGLKWPNDLLFGNAKLAGILLEMTGDASGECQVIIGIGLNVAMQPEQAEAIDQPWTDLQSIKGGTVSRNELLAAVLNELVPMLDRFKQFGFEPFAEEWMAANAFQSLPVELQLGDQLIQGVCRGVNGSGALLLEREGETKAYHGGEISVRRA
ncbi:bifunctional biotin--[acetyl-CoA-carboxylase] ligase/biotin operon repressor BirA [Marinobacterium jannaschii]|uniref:bifunctional biotin--[acetyl-CoA-carboxylase] ligase/biotin operon repressor BirA n=1 Tax=Marinobacterium jannaschii TaxID=64970 RepID=UPI00047F34DE|nr:bifunctional biotin--[acetyl-CoA-carboxylase] ligase/biotin operon repressor BirA [Marinobacterium jannaschii]